MANTKDILIAERYSDALAEMAQEGKLTYSEISSDLNKIKNILSMSRDLDEVLINPIIATETKIDLVNSVFQGELNLLILNFLKVLIEKDRFSVFNEVLDAFNKEMDKINNISRISVISAVEISEDAKSRLKIKLEEKLKTNVILDLNIDSGIIAGLIIKMGDNVVDMSLKHKLESLSKSITK